MLQRRPQEAGFGAVAAVLVLVLVLVRLHQVLRTRADHVAQRSGHLPWQWKWQCTWAKSAVSEAGVASRCSDSACWSRFPSSSSCGTRPIASIVVGGRGVCVARGRLARRLPTRSLVRPRPRPGHEAPQLRAVRNLGRLRRLHVTLRRPLRAGHGRTGWFAYRCTQAQVSPAARGATPSPIPRARVCGQLPRLGRCHRAL